MHFAQLSAQQTEAVNFAAEEGTLGKMHRGFQTAFQQHQVA